MSKFKIGDRVIWANPDRDTHPAWHYVKGRIITGPDDVGGEDFYGVHPDGYDDDWAAGVGVRAYGYELERYYDKKERA